MFGYKNSHSYFCKLIDKNSTIFLYFVYVDKDNKEESFGHSIDNHNFQPSTNDHDASLGEG